MLPDPDDVPHSSPGVHNGPGKNCCPLGDISHLESLIPFSRNRFISVLMQLSMNRSNVR